MMTATMTTQIKEMTLVREQGQQGHVHKRNQYNPAGTKRLIERTRCIALLYDSRLKTSNFLFYQEISVLAKVFLGIICVPTL